MGKRLVGRDSRYKNLPPGVPVMQRAVEEPPGKLRTKKAQQ
jgi:hypothetical protein